MKTGALVVAVVLFVIPVGQFLVGAEAVEFPLLALGLALFAASFLVPK